MNTIKPIQVTEAEYAELSENYGGFCVECGEIAYGVEPDARRYRCEACGANAVFGAEELLIRGILCFTEDDPQ